MALLDQQPDRKFDQHQEILDYKNRLNPASPGLMSKPPQQPQPQPQRNPIGPGKEERIGQRNTNEEYTEKVRSILQGQYEREDVDVFNSNDPIKKKGLVGQLEPYKNSKRVNPMDRIRALRPGGNGQDAPDNGFEKSLSSTRGIDFGSLSFDQDLSKGAKAAIGKLGSMGYSKAIGNLTNNPALQGAIASGGIAAIGAAAKGDFEGMLGAATKGSIQGLIGQGIKSLGVTAGVATGFAMGVYGGMKQGKDIATAMADTSLSMGMNFGAAAIGGLVAGPLGAAVASLAAAAALGNNMFSEGVVGDAFDARANETFRDTYEKFDLSPTEKAQLDRMANSSVGYGAQLSQLEKSLGLSEAGLTGPGRHDMSMGSAGGRSGMGGGGRDGRGGGVGSGDHSGTGAGGGGVK